MPKYNDFDLDLQKTTTPQGDNFVHSYDDNCGGGTMSGREDSDDISFCPAV